MRGREETPNTMAFNFGAPAATTNPPAGFSFSTSSSGSDAAPKVGFNFGGAAPASANPSTTTTTTTTTTAPIASTGFSFGGPSAPAAATTPPAPAFGGGLFNLSGGSGGEDSSSSSSSTSNKKKAPSGSGFSFGGLSAATTTTNDGGSSSQATPAAKLGGGAGFGGGLFGLTPGTTPAARVPPPVETPNTVVGGSSAVSSATPGVSTPASSAISPPATAAAPASQSTTTTDTAPKMIEPPPVEYQTLTVEQILNRFQSELETDSIAFLSEAQRVAHYDATLRDSQASLSELTNAVSRLMLHQTEVNAQLQGIGSYQDELSKTLDLLERNVDELFAGRSNIRVEDADIDRERSYERAIDVDNKLDSMCSTLRHVVNDLDAAQERFWSSTLRSNGEGGDDEVGKIIGVFNAHHEALGHLESKARSLESDLTMVSQVLAKSGQ